MQNGGTIAGPVEGPAGERLGLALETVIDRTSFGITWNMELPGGGFILDNEVTLSADLELVGRGAPAPEHRPGERVEREPVIARIQKPERAAGGQHGPEVLEALSVGRRASDQRPGLAAEAHRAGSRAPRTPQPFRFHEHRLRQAGGARGEHHNSWSIERPEGRATDRARRRIRQHERNQTESLGLRRQRRHRRHERDRRTDRDGGLGAPRARVGRQEDGGRWQ